MNEHNLEDVEIICECGVLISEGETRVWDSESATWIHAACVEAETETGGEQ